MADLDRQKLVMVTGPSGAGRSSAIHALEDFGFEAIDNLPLSLIPRLFDGPPLVRPIALGLDTRNREFSLEALIDIVASIRDNPAIDAELLYLDCDASTLVQRFSETRRRHPLRPDETPLSGVQFELGLLAPLRESADVVIDTTRLTPHQLRSELKNWFAPVSGAPMVLSVQSFSYKRGLPRGVDMVFDCRFLANPHWEPALRAHDGRDADVAAYVASDPRFAEFFDRVHGLVASLLIPFVEEGKTALTIAFGCTGGKHRSVALAEKLAAALEDSGWKVSKRHRELDRNSAVTAPVKQG